MSLLHVRVVSPADLRDEVEALLRGQRGATNLVVLPGAAREPCGDLIQADLARECVQTVLSGLRGLGVDRRAAQSAWTRLIPRSVMVCAAPSAMRRVMPPMLSSGRRSSPALAKTRR
jgi:hypothetical protein